VWAPWVTSRLRRSYRLCDCALRLRLQCGVIASVSIAWQKFISFRLHGTKLLIMLRVALTLCKVFGWAKDGWFVEELKTERRWWFLSVLMHRRLKRQFVAGQSGSKTHHDRLATGTHGERKVFEVWIARLWALGWIWCRLEERQSQIQRFHNSVDVERTGGRGARFAGGGWGVSYWLRMTRRTTCFARNARRWWCLAGEHNGKKDGE